MKKISGKKTLLVTSFHRSGSSMVGKMLSTSGLFMGENLLQAHRSNPDGHFEDLEIMQAHDKALTKCGSSWQFYGSETLTFDDDDKNYFTTLITTRNQQHHSWGFKDPRSCLFLDNWNQLLGETGCYLFLYRHYSECIVSLYRRHSQLLCLDTIGNYTSPGVLYNLNFWIDANLAAKMWLAYNNKLLSFFTQNRDKSLLISQQAILSGYPLIKQLNEKFDFELNVNHSNIIQKNYTNNETKKFELGVISNDLYEEMDDLWEKLNHIADVPCSAPKTYSETKYLNLPTKIESLINRFNPSETLAPPVKNTAINDSKPLTLEAKINLHLQKNECQSALELLPALIKLAPLKAESWILAGSIYMRDNNFDKAEQSYCYAIALNPNIPYFYMHLGLAFLAQDKQIEAEHFLQQAAYKNPKNPLFFFHLGNFYCTYQQFDKAKSSFKQALDIESNNTQFINRYCQFLIETEETEEALLFLKSRCDNNPSRPIINQYALLLLKSGDYAAAMSWYKKHDSLALKNEDLATWLTNILAKITDNEMRENFQYWLYHHWSEVIE